MPQENKQTSSSLLQTERQALGDKITVHQPSISPGCRCNRIWLRGTGNRKQDVLFADNIWLSESLCIVRFPFHGFGLHSLIHTHTHKCEKRESASGRFAFPWLCSHVSSPSLFSVLEEQGHSTPWRTV